MLCQYFHGKYHGNYQKITSKNWKVYGFFRLLTNNSDKTMIETLKVNFYVCVTFLKVAFEFESNSKLDWIPTKPRNLSDLFISIHFHVFRCLDSCRILLVKLIFFLFAIVSFCILTNSIPSRKTPNVCLLLSVWFSFSLNSLILSTTAISLR